MLALRENNKVVNKLGREVPYQSLGLGFYQGRYAYGPLADKESC